MVSWAGSANTVKYSSDPNISSSKRAKNVRKLCSPWSVFFLALLFPFCHPRIDANFAA